jgi:predicted MFS family arabinose efflux permease
MVHGLCHLDFALFALYGVVYSIASFGTDGLLTLHLSQISGIDTTALGIFGMWKGIGALLGALMFAVALPRLGVGISQILALVLLGLGCLLPVFLIEPIWTSGILWGLIWGFQETAFVTVAMGFAEGAWAATVFALCMIFSNLGTALGEALGGQLLGHLGFNLTFMIFAGVAWGSLVFGSRTYLSARAKK